jgi:GMP synthase (glutamine-hydrolysing)
MSILVFRHEPFEHLGLLAAPLAGNVTSFHYLDLDDSTTAEGYPPVAERYQALIVLGGPMSANDPLPGLARELRQIREALEQGLPILGICLGSQLIAKALGARVYRNPKLEIGWEPVHLTPAGHSDPLFAGIDSPTTFFHWHGETFELPAGAEWLAYSEKCRHQAYRFGRNVYGLQFHPEVDAAMIDDWSRQPVNCADAATLGHPLDPHAHNQSAIAARILNNWLAVAGIAQDR